MSAGIVSKRSSLSVAETVDRLRQEIGSAGARLFAVIDHSGEAASVGLSLRDTKLILFGNPALGTEVMAEEPLAALDLPLKILVWRDDGGSTPLDRSEPWGGSLARSPTRQWSDWTIPIPGRRYA
jgi:uncharacterized protein (DUF302 family)